MNELDSVRRELDELRARYAVMVERAPEAIVVLDLDNGRFAEVNSAACRFYGLDREALLATGPVALSPEEQPDGRRSGRAAAEFLQRTLEESAPVEFDWMHVDARGEPRPCRIQLVPVPVPGRRLVRGVLQDLRETRAAEHAREELLRVIEESNDIIGMADPSGQVLYLNAAARAQFALAPDQPLEGLSIHRWHPPEVVERILLPSLEEARREGSWHGRNELQAEDGRRFPVSQVLIAHTDDRGELEYYSTIARDVSGERALEEAQQLESLGVLAGGVAHDFNNLLVGILGNVSLLLEDLEPASPLHPVAEEVETASRRAADLATQMLAFAGRAKLERQPVELDELVPDVAALLRTSMSMKAEVRQDLAPDVPSVLGDPTQLRQVLMNLLLNASEALGPDGGRITIRTGVGSPDRSELLHDFLHPCDGERPLVFLEVEDTGPGMDEALVARIFDPFFSTKFAGRGLGLAALLGIVRMHGGGVAVDAGSGRGVRFTVWLPGSARGAAQVAAPAPAEVSTRPGRVLVVEDETAVRSVIRRTLERAGIVVVEAEDGLAGLEAFRADPTGFDVLVLDLTMPRLSGEELLAEVRELAPGQPIVLTSGYSADDVQLEGPTVFVHKPFRPAELRDAVVRVGAVE